MKLIARVFLAALCLATPLVPGQAAAQTFAGSPVIPVYSADADKGFSPAVAVSPGDGFAAVWRGNENGLFARGFLADGTPLTPAAVLISPPHEGAAVQPDLAPLSSGGYVATWTRSGTPIQSAALFRLLNAAGQSVGGGDVGVQTANPHVAGDATGHFVLTWEGTVLPSFAGVAVQRFANNGTPATDMIAVDGEGSASDVAAFPDGRFAVVWNGEGGVYFRLFGTEGNPLTPPTLIALLESGTAPHDVRVAAVAGRFVTVWTETTGTSDRILARLWGADGLPLGPEIVVAEPAPGVDRGTAQSVAMRPDGSFLVHWEGNQSLIRRFDPQGLPVSDPLPIAVTGGLRVSDVAAASDSWLVAWPKHDLNAAPANGPWVQRLIAACGNAGLCLKDRFLAEVVWRLPDGRNGSGTPIPLTGDTGAFWFFAAANYELAVKVLDGRGINGRFWVFYGSLTDVAFDLTVTDTWTGQQRTYHNPAGTMASQADTEAFPQ